MTEKKTSDSLIGTTIGNYVVQSKLGSGAMGTVYLGEHPEIGKRVAIKILAIHLAENSNMVERFMVEARAIGILEHPNIIEMFDFGVLEDGRSYYTMEYLQGETLSQRMKRGNFALWELTGILDQICDALFVVHEKGIIHRDMKPSNIYLAKKGTRILLKILDFGIAKIQDGLKKDGEFMTSTGAVLGTPVFMAPEQALGQNDRISHLSDIYSLGVILYKILTDRFPINGTSIPEVVAWHFLNEAIPLREVNPRIPEPLAQVVMKCLKKDPTARHLSSAHLFSEYQEAVALLPPDWVVPASIALDSTQAALALEPNSLPGNMLESAPSAHSGSSSFYPPPPPPPPSDSSGSFNSMVQVPAELTSHSLVGGGSAVATRSAVSPKILMAVLGTLLVLGLGGYFLFFRDTNTTQTPPPPAPVTVATPSPEKSMEPVPPEEPVRELIQVRFTSEPEAEMVVTRKTGDPVTRQTPFEMEFELSEEVHVTASKKGYLEKSLTLRMMEKSVNLTLEPVPADIPMPPMVEKPVVTTPPMRVAPVPPPMKAMQHDKKTLGNELL